MKFQSSDLQVDSFEGLQLHPQILVNLKKMGISFPTRIQAQAIPVALKSDNAIVVAQTGTGKTLAFGIPITQLLLTKPDSRALVFAPSREVASQIFKVLSDLLQDSNLKTVLVIGGTPNKEQVSSLKKKPRLIVATPGRMNDHLLENKLLLQGTNLVVIDEADRMMDMGFSKQLESVRKTMRGHFQVLMFSASFDKSIETVAEKFMQADPFLIRSATAEKPVEQLSQKIFFVSQGMKNDLLAKELKSTKGSVIVFASNQPECESIGHHLVNNGFSSDFIHGGLNPGHRNRVLREFREEKIQIMITTDLLARGLDVEHIQCVVNYNVPHESEDFLHRIGRTARAGRKGLAITFITPRDEDMYQKIKKYMEGAEEIRF
jgi:ATP-dependent RNA helicase RhlE